MHCDNLQAPPTALAMSLLLSLCLEHIEGAAGGHSGDAERRGEPSIEICR